MRVGRQAGQGRRGRRAADARSTRSALSEEQAKAVRGADRRSRSAADGLADQVRGLGVEHPLLDEGLDELLRVLERHRRRCSPSGSPSSPTCSIARGLDYYTGTVFETRMAGFEHLGSICSGGRYDALASDGRTTYPGVGISLRRDPHDRAAAVARPARRATRSDADLRPGRAAGRGVAGRPAGEVAPRPARPRRARPRSPRRRTKYGKQIRYAERRGIPFVWFPQDDGTHQVRDIRTGEQVDADPRRGSHRRRTCAPA